MKGYQLTKAFWTVCDHNETMQANCTGNHHSLYTWICELSNQIGREIMDLPVRYTMKMAFIGSDHTLKKCIDDLCNWGIIEILQRGSNQHAPTKIKLTIENLLSQICDTDAKAMRNHCESDAKPLRQTKTIKTKRTIKTILAMAVEGFEHLVGIELTDAEYQALIKKFDKEETDQRLDEFKVKRPPGKIAYRENVLLTEKEYETLSTKYGKPFAELCLDKLHFAKLAKGYVYKSDYGAINQWVVGEVQKGKGGKTDSNGMVY